jgi:hypothetical protein
MLTKRCGACAGCYQALRQPMERDSDLTKGFVFTEGDFLSLKRLGSIRKERLHLQEIWTERGE